MRWKTLRRSVVVVLVPVGVVVGAVAVCAGVVQGAILLDVPVDRVSPFIGLIFLVALMALAKLGGWILWPAAGMLDRTVPLPRPTAHQRFWRFGKQTKGWIDSIVVATTSIGAAFAAGIAADRFGLGSWGIVALAVPAWLIGIVIAVRTNMWIDSKLQRYRPPGETETLIQTFD